MYNISSHKRQVRVLKTLELIPTLRNIFLDPTRHLAKRQKNWQIHAKQEFLFMISHRVIEKIRMSRRISNDIANPKWHMVWAIQKLEQNYAR